jgi:hypothetical protein
MIGKAVLSCDYFSSNSIYFHTFLLTTNERLTALQLAEVPEGYLGESR